MCSFTWFCCWHHRHVAGGKREGGGSEAVRVTTAREVQEETAVLAAKDVLPLLDSCPAHWWVAGVARWPGSLAACSGIAVHHATSYMHPYIVSFTWESQHELLCFIACRYSSGQYVLFFVHLPSNHALSSALPPLAEDGKHTGTTVWLRALVNARLCLCHASTCCTEGVYIMCCFCHCCDAAGSMLASDSGKLAWMPLRQLEQLDASRQAGTDWDSAVEISTLLKGLLREKQSVLLPYLQLCKQLLASGQPLPTGPQAAAEQVELDTPVESAAVEGSSDSDAEEDQPGSHKLSIAGGVVATATSLEALVTVNSSQAEGQVQEKKSTGQKVPLPLPPGFMRRTTCQVFKRPDGPTWQLRLNKVRKWFFKLGSGKNISGLQLEVQREGVAELLQLSKARFYV